MSRYDEIMNKVSLSEEARERILQKTEKEAVKYEDTPPGNAALRRRKYLAAAACFVLIIAGAASVWQRSGFRQDPAGMETLSNTDDRYAAAGDAALEENEEAGPEEAAVYGKDEAGPEEEAAVYDKKEAVSEDDAAAYGKDEAASNDDAMGGEKEEASGKKSLGGADLPGTEEGPGHSLGLAITRGTVKYGYLLRCQALDIYQEIID